MAEHGIIIGERCTVCSEYVNPNEVVLIGHAVKLCWKCYEAHKIQIAGVQPPTECPICHVSCEELQARQPGDTFAMYLHWIDGTYQLLCPECDKAYVLKRQDLYGDTPFGYARGVK